MLIYWIYDIIIRPEHSVYSVFGHLRLLKMRTEFLKRKTRTESVYCMKFRVFAMKNMKFRVPCPERGPLSRARGGPLANYTHSSFPAQTLLVRLIPLGKQSRPASGDSTAATRRQRRRRCSDLTPGHPSPSAARFSPGSLSIPPLGLHSSLMFRCSPPLQPTIPLLLWLPSPPLFRPAL